MVDTNVRVTKDTHERIKTLADLKGKTISEVIDDLIIKHAPEVEEAIRVLRVIKEKSRSNEN